MQTNWWSQTFNEEYGRAFNYFYGPEKTEVEIDFLKNIVGLKEKSTVLDMPCGQGRHVLALSKFGCGVTGVDYSQALVEMAEKRLADAGTHAIVKRGDMRTVDLGTEFDAVVMLGNSFGYFSDEDNVQVLANVARHLKRGGSFVLDLANTAGLIRNPLGVSDNKYPDGFIKTDAHAFDPLTMRLSIRWEIGSQGKVSRTSGQIRLYTVPEITRLMNESGLKVKSVFGDFRGGEFTQESPRCVVVGEKCG